MRRNGRTQAPEDRRLRLLRTVVLGIGVLLAARVVHLQVFEHERWQRIADHQWSKIVDLEPERGVILDRHGRPLAMSAVTYDLGVSPQYVDCVDSTAATVARILGGDPADYARRIAAAEGHLPLARGVSLTDEQTVALLRRYVNVDRKERRLYPTDGVGASLIGYCRQDADSKRAAGLEALLDDRLTGEAGRARLHRTGQSRVNLGHTVLEPVRHGRDVVTSIDIDLQAISEDCLSAALERTGAASGSVLILEPETGDILAAASAPLMETRRQRQPDPAVWNNRNFTVPFEPGSLAKVFTGSALLRHGAVDTFTAFDGDGEYKGIGNSDDKPYGHLAFTAALILSNNVYFAKAVENLLETELYEDLVTWGFGRKTALEYPAEAAGELRAPDEWSGRSRHSLAIGQEMSATALQLGLALGAIANGGYLNEPRVVREIHEHGGGAIEEVQPVSLRRVMAPPLAELMADGMRRVVSEGTGRHAALAWLEAAGKTGTAEKALPGRGYVPGLYVSSFGGFVPADRPRLVILAVLDEPDRHHYYASDSAAPLFREIVTEIARCTSWLDGVARSDVHTVTQMRTEPVPVPDVLYLTARNAATRLEAAGLTVQGHERDGVVVGQVPAAGTRYAPGRPVTLTVRSAHSDAAAESLVPDLRGRSDREVRSLAARLGLAVRIEGSGYVVAQDLRPGSAVGTRPLTVRMAASWN